MSIDLLGEFDSGNSPRERKVLASTTQDNHKIRMNQKTFNLVDDNPWILDPGSVSYSQSTASAENSWKHRRKETNVLFDASDFEVDEDDFGDFEDPIVDKQVKNFETFQAPVPTFMNTDLLGLNDDYSEIQPPTSQTISDSNSTTANQSINHIGRRIQQLPLYEAMHSCSKQLMNDDDDDWNDFEQPGGDIKDTTTTTAPEVAAIESVKEQPLISLTSAQTLKHSGVSQPVTDTTLNNVTDPNVNDEEEDEEVAWGEFDDSPMSPRQQSIMQQEKQSLPPSSQLSSVAIKSTDLTKSRPTNVPPPSTLFQLLPQIYQQLTQQSRSSNQPSSQDLALLILQVYVTTAHVIAGRAHRWKRDTILAQSMRISQVSGLKSSGMKLTALDKSESIKEDQEVQEVVTAWLRNAAFLNAIMVKSKVTKPPMALSNNMTARIANGGGAVLNSKESCAVCGLKRNERVVGIDVNVEDSFGEFWIEYWGHRDCYEFWYKWEGSLRRR